MNDSLPPTLHRCLPSSPVPSRFLRPCLEGPHVIWENMVNSYLQVRHFRALQPIHSFDIRRAFANVYFVWTLKRCVYSVLF